MNGSQVVAAGWGDLVGTLVSTPTGIAINWANGSTWAQTHLPTSWSMIGSLATGVAQSEYLTIFTNEHAAQTRVIFAGANQVVALDWGDLVGKISTTARGLQISWMNGTAWSSG
jgi:hypothetical protein